MERTPFAGLTALDEDDPITIDGGSFGIRNPRITDTLLRVGAVTHHHDAHAAVPSPHVALSGFVASGGSIAASSNFALTYTVLDQQGGETAAAPPLLLSTGGQTPAPTIAPSATVVTSAGILPEGDYYYALTYTDGAGGETTIGPTTLITVPPGFASASVLLSSLAQELAPHGLAAQWRLWRSYEGEDWHLVSQASNDSFDDAGFDPPDNPARPPGQNTTAAHFALVVTLPTAAQDAALASGSLINLYLAPDANFTDPCFYQQLPIASAGATIVIPLDTVSEGSPPPVSLSKQGANQINPDTDILDWHWKRPVVTMTALPSGSQGDVRLALDNGHPYAVLSPSGAVNFHGWTDLLQLASGVIADIDIGIGVAASGRVGLVDPVEYVEFAASAGAASVSVVDLGGGSARVLIPTGGGGGGGTSLTVAASAGASAVSPDSYIEFAGSGGIGVAVQALPGAGSARVLIGPDGGALHWRGAYFGGSGYTVNDVVTAFGDTWRANQRVLPGSFATSQWDVVTGSAAVPSIAGSAGVSPVNPDYYTEYAGSGGVGVAIQGLGLGSARVLVGPDTNALHWRGAWSSAATYASNDLTQYGNRVWRRNAALIPVMPTFTGRSEYQGTADTGSLQIPATAQPGDIAILTANCWGTSVPTIAGVTGFAQLATRTAINTFQNTCTVFTKTLTAADIGATVNLSGMGPVNPNEVEIRTYTSQGLDPGAVATASGTGAPFAPPMLSARQAQEMQVSVFDCVQNSMTSVSLSAGGGDQAAILNPGNHFGSIASEDFPLVASGATGVGGSLSPAGGTGGITFIAISLLLLPALGKPTDPPNLATWDILSASGVTLAGSAGVTPTAPESYIEFTGSGGIAVAVQDLGGGSGRVVVGPGDGNTATLSGGTVVVNDPSVTATTRIMLSAQDNNTTGALRVSARTPGTSFTITSSNAGDTGVVAYQFFGS